MPETGDTPTPEEGRPIQARPVEPTPAQVSETFMASAMQIMSANSYTPTQAQVDKMLGLQEKGMDYAHKERTTFLPHQIAALILIFLFVISVVGVFVFCVFYAPSFVPQIIAGAFGLLSGGGVGYGVGYKKGRNKREED